MHPNDSIAASGPFDIIGDIHGCYDETVELLLKLGYQINALEVSHPEKRIAIFLGDLVDRGPKSPAVLRLVMRMVGSGIALCVLGNHDVKLLKKLNGRNVNVNPGLARTLEQLEGESTDFITEVIAFFQALPFHFVLDKGRLVVAHAGLKERMHGKQSDAVTAFCLFGETTGEIDQFGLPVRGDWAVDYKGEALVVYGHTAVKEAEWRNRTIDIDTGCVFGGKLTALRYPELELVSVPARQVYSEPLRPIEGMTLLSSPKNDPSS